MQKTFVGVQFSGKRDASSPRCFPNNIFLVIFLFCLFFSWSSQLLVFFRSNVRMISSCLHVVFLSSPQFLFPIIFSLLVLCSEDAFFLSFFSLSSIIYIGIPFHSFLTCPQFQFFLHIKSIHYSCCMFCNMSCFPYKVFHHSSFISETLGLGCEWCWKISGRNIGLLIGRMLQIIKIPEQYWNGWAAALCLWRECNWFFTRQSKLCD